MRSSRADLAALRALGRQERWLLLEAWLLVPLVVLGLRFAGHRTTKRWAGRLGLGRPRGHDVDLTVERVVRMTDAAISRSPVTATCLPRSITIWVLLRRRGLDADVVIGVRAGGAPLDAHAWVERGGHPVSDAPESLVGFLRLDADPAA